MPHNDWNKSVSIFRYGKTKEPRKFSVMLGELYPSIFIYRIFRSTSFCFNSSIFASLFLSVSRYFPFIRSFVRVYVSAFYVYLCVCVWVCVLCILILFREQVVIATSNDVAVCKSMRFIVCNSNVKFSLLSIVFFNILCVFAVYLYGDDGDGECALFQVCLCSSCFTFIQLCYGLSVVLVPVWHRGGCL